MKTKLIILVTLCLLAGLFGGKQSSAKFGISKTRATFMMHHPPAFYTAKREITVQASSIDPRGGSMLAPRLQQLIGQKLILGNFQVLPAAPTQLQVTVNVAQATVESQTRSQSVYAHVRFRSEYDKEGKPRRVEDCEFREGSVTYLMSTGSLLVNLVATERETQAVLFTREISQQYSEESQTHGPKLCGGATYGVKPTQLRDPQSILARLSGEAVTSVVRLVAGYDEPREVLLAVDKELKSGNAHALGGNWQQALETWKTAAIQASKRKKEAARQYNVGVAHEALAALAMRRDDFDLASQTLEEAEQCYARALELDAGEKYFRDTLARVQQDRAVLHKEQEQHFLKQAEIANLSPAKLEPEEPLKVSIPLEGWPDGESDLVHNFRVYVRARLENRGEGADEEFQAQLIAEGKEFEVKEGIAMGVVQSEVDRCLVFRQNQQKYREFLRELASDGVVSADERNILRIRQKTLHLSGDMTGRVEAEFGFTEQGVARASGQEGP